jgi:hypothetical protein
MRYTCFALSSNSAVPSLIASEERERLSFAAAYWQFVSPVFADLGVGDAVLAIRQFCHCDISRPTVCRLAAES